MRPSLHDALHDALQPADEPARRPIVAPPLPPAISATILPARRPADSLTSCPGKFDVVVRFRPGATPQRFTVTPDSRGDSVADLIAALDGPAGPNVLIDGRLVAAEVSLVDSGVANGSLLEFRTQSPAPPTEVVIEVSCVAGPDCMPWHGLGVGRHVIGRSSSAGICLDDRRIELHHALLEIDDGRLLLTQLAGQPPLRVDGAPIDGSREVALPATLSIGSSQLRIRRAEAPLRPRTNRIGNEARRSDLGSIVDSPNDPWRRVVHRAPEVADRVTGAPIVAPLVASTHRAPPATALIGAAVGVLGAGVIAVALGQMMFAVFALFGAGASAATWAVGVVSTSRSNRRERRQAAADRLRFMADLEMGRQMAHALRQRTTPAVEELVAMGAAIAHNHPGRTGVWSRRVVGSPAAGDEGPGDVGRRFRIVVGRGTSRWVPAIDGDVPPELASDADRATVLDDVPDAVTLRAGDVVTVIGDRDERHAMVRSVLCQLAVLHGPADWQLMVVSADPSAWEWTVSLPHSRAMTSGPAVIDPTDDDMLAAALGADADRSRATVLFVDDASLFAIRTGHLRRFIDRAAPLTLTCVGPDGAVPALTRTTIAVGATGGVSVSTSDDGAGLAEGRRMMCGVAQHRAAHVARALARLVDPEESSSPGSSVPTGVALSEIEPTLRGVTRSADTEIELRAAVSAVGRRWRSAGPDPAPRTAIGRSADGVVEIDLTADGPHALIAGTTGSGKSELLRSLVVGLALRHRPEHLTFVLVDYKGGSTFDRCSDLPHTVGVVTDLDAGLAERALVSLDAELHRRERLLRAVGAADLADYRRHTSATPLPRLVVVVDEFAALAKELPDFLTALIGVAQRGRSLGLHLILATQRPAGVVNDDIRANTNLRLALRLNDTSDAHDVVGDVVPADFGRDVPGRSALRLGPGELIVFQAARCSGPARRPRGGLAATAAGSVDTFAEDAEVHTELDVAVHLATEAARELAIDAPHRPWIDALPDRLSCATVDLVADAVDHGGVGVVDDPAHQSWRVLGWDRDAGNLAVVGALGTGTTSTLRAVIAERCRRRSADREHWYVLDAHGDPSLDELTRLEHVGAVVGLHESERLHRVLRRLSDEIDRRAEGSSGETCVSLAIDGMQSLRTALSSVEHAATLALLDRVLADGPAAGVMTCWTDVGARTSRSADAAEIWVFRCASDDVARSAGVAPVASAVPGRLRVASCGREAQVAVDAGHLTVSTADSPPDVVLPAPVNVLPHRVAPDDLPAGATGRQMRDGLQLDVGLAYADLAVASLQVPGDDHLFIGGAASTGKTTALHHVVAAWQSARPNGVVIWVDRRHPLPFSQTDGGVEPMSVLVAVDDAERIDDVDGRLAAIAAGAHPNATIVAAARLETVRSAYGHWARDVARSRCGLIFTSAGDVDGDLLGASLPRRTPVAPRPGLAWVIDGSGHRLVQIVDAQPLDVLPSNQRGPVPY